MANEILGIFADVFPFLVREIEITVLNSMEESRLAIWA
jgi:hypothetical protein